MLISSDTQELVSKDEINLITQIQFKSYLIAYIRFNWTRDVTEAMLYEMKNKILHSTLTEELIKSTLAGFNTENDLVILINGSYSGSSAAGLLDILTKQFNFSYTYSIGLSKLQNTVHNYRMAYLEAKNASALQFYYGTKQIIEYRDFYSFNYEPSSSIYIQFNEALKNPDMNHSLKIIKDLYRDIILNKPESAKVKSIYTALFTILDTEARKTNNPIYDFIKIKQIISEIDKTYLLKDIHELLVHNINVYYDSQVHIASKNNRTREIVQYIKKNISDSQLSVNTISKTFQLSQAYLCSYFKKETNMTINQCITNIRIEHSKYLLSYTNDKIYDIALNVGYCDTNYFSALFKKQTGISPLEYRKGKK